MDSEHATACSFPPARNDTEWPSDALSATAWAPRRFRSPQFDEWRGQQLRHKMDTMRASLPNVEQGESCTAGVGHQVRRSSLDRPANSPVHHRYCLCSLLLHLHLTKRVSGK